MGILAASLRTLDSAGRVCFARNMILNHWDNLSAKQINFFTRYIRMFSNKVA